MAGTSACRMPMAELIFRNLNHAQIVAVSTVELWRNEKMRITRLISGLSALAVSSGMAMALPTVKLQSETPSEIQTVHYSHRSCQRGPAGWHYHFHGERIACDPRPSGREWGWRHREGRWGWWHERERRWHN